MPVLLASILRPSSTESAISKLHWTGPSSNPFPLRAQRRARERRTPYSLTKSTKPFHTLSSPSWEPRRRLLKPRRQARWGSLSRRGAKPRRRGRKARRGRRGRETGWQETRGATIARLGWWRAGREARGRRRQRSRGGRALLLLLLLLVRGRRHALEGGGRGVRREAKAGWGHRGAGDAVGVAV